MRMNAVLSNPKHPEYGQFTVPLPIPHNQYDGIMEALNAMDMGDPLARDCQMDEILGEYPILKRLEGKPVNIDELDYLAKRLDSFCYAQEGAQFQGAAVSYDYSDMTDLINLTFSCQQVTVITDFSDLEQVGRDHYMVLNGGCASKEELDALDGYETALLLIDEGNGVITPYGVASTQSARQHKDATDLVMNLGEVQNDSKPENETLVLLIRRLTPLECERLQGFPDGWTDIEGASDSARYKALGNSVAIPCVDYVLQGIAWAITAQTA